MIADLSEKYGASWRRLMVFFVFISISMSAWGQTQTFTGNGTFTVPPGVKSIVVECWGAGGAGGGTSVNNAMGGGGGAGGAYAKKTISVTPGDNYTVTVGGVTTGNQGAGSAGSPSWFGTTGTVYAQGGAGGEAPNGGTVAGGTGSAGSSIGDVVYAGGSGANGTATLSGGGGGGAGSTGAGGNAAGTTPGTGTSLNGGNGGTGLTIEGDGNTGVTYGGGGGGAYVPDNTNHNGGNGEAGLVVISWTGSLSYTSSNTFTAPTGVTSIIVECWGGGGAGGAGTGNPAAGGGGAGGAYSIKILTVVPGNNYTVTVGTGGTGGSGDGPAGNPTWFGSTATVYAEGGAGGALASAISSNGAGGTGSSSSSIGDITYKGGDGANGIYTSGTPGGAGGGGAGTTGIGNSAVTGTGGAAKAMYGGSGANGVADNTPGADGSVYGGGGSGGKANNGADRNGGSGAGGLVIITLPHFSYGNSNPSDVNNWWTNSNGTGSHPSDFTSGNKIFIIQNGNTYTTSSAWNVSGMNNLVVIQNGGVLQANNDITFSATSTFQIDNGGIYYQNHNINNNIFNGTNILADGSTVNYILSGNQTVEPIIYSNLTLSGSGVKTISGTSVNAILSMEGIATTAGSAPTYGGTSTLQYSGSASQTTGIELPAAFDGSGGVIINNSDGVTLSISNTITGSLILTNGEFVIGDNTLTFHTSDIPIVRTSGTLTTTGNTNLQFGTPGNTGGSPFNIPNGTFTSGPSINNLSIYRTNSLTLNDQVVSLGGILLCNGPMNTNNNLLLLSTAAGTALIDGSGTGEITGNVTMQRYLPSGFGYKYFTSPFQASTVNEFADDMTLGYYTFFKYDESRTASGWVNYHTPTTNTLNPLQGYAVNFGSLSAANTVDLTGNVNNGSLSVTLYNNNNTYTQGFNLVGNPYPSPIDWDALSGWTKTNIDDAIYLFKASTTDQYGGTYTSYVNGIPPGLDMNIIPSMQGFFVHVTDGAYPVTGTLGMDNNVRITNLTHPFTKSKGVNPVPLLTLEVSFSDDTASVDPAIIYFDEKGSGEFDSYLDALKLFNTDLKVPNLYTITPLGKKLSINALPPMSDDFITVPLGLKLNRAGNIILRISNIEESLTGRRIFISDIITGTEQDLLPDKQFSIILSQGEYLNRFFLNFSNITTGMNEIKPETGMFSIYGTEGLLKAEINILIGNKGSLMIHNLTGQLLYRKEIFNTGYHEFSPDVQDGIYIVTYLSGSQRSSRKIIILK